MIYLSKANNFISKYRAYIIAVLVFVLAFSCVVLFGGNVSESDTSVPEVSTPAPVQPAEQDGYALYVDGSFIACLEDKGDIESVLDGILYAKSEALGIAPGTTRALSNEIEILEGAYEPKFFTDINGLCDMLDFDGKKNVGEYVTDYNSTIQNVTFGVVSVETVTEEVVLVHNVKKIYTDSLRDGTTKVITSGVDGEGVDTYQVIYRDGVEIERVLVSSVVVTEKVDKVIKVGTKIPEKVTLSAGLFDKPYDGIISSYFGARWGRLHKGLDIVADGRSCKGDPVLAAGDGIVKFSGTYGGYGNCVIIDHGNGIETLYAHMMDLTCTEGQIIKKGDMVGHIGTTGSSTGYHLHFEVIVDGVHVDPLLFVSYGK